MMDGSYLSNPLVFLIEVIFGTYVLVLMLRFVLQLVHADFYNPVSQFIVRVTSPVLHPLRRVIPAMAGMDTASLVAMWLFKSLELGLILLVTGSSASLAGVVLWALPELVRLAINLFLYAILIEVILSWVNPGSYNPAVGLVQRITAPLLTPARRLIPPIGGLDLSPMLVMIGLVLLKMLLIPPLQLLVATPFR
ncbi:MAG TPA: YggT family protein [Sedimenticola sp.]|nr:YggT family protein [Sedimenticola sp.]